jgi:hypothetical protein
MHYDAYRFVQSIREKYWLGMLSAIDAALIAEARRPADGSGQHPGNDADFMRFLMASREYLMSEGRTRPAAMHDEEFSLLQPLCEHLVQQGRFAPERLALFAGLDPWHVATGQDLSQNDGESQSRRA